MKRLAHDDWSDEDDAFDDEARDEDPGDDDIRRFDEDDAEDVVTCISCGKSIWAHAQQCGYCGARYVGEAWQGDVVGGRPGPAIGRFWWWVAVVLLTAMALSLLLWGTIL